jgi:hypothetical protein
MTRKTSRAILGLAFFSLYILHQAPVVASSVISGVTPCFADGGTKIIINKKAYICAPNSIGNVTWNLIADKKTTLKPKASSARPTNVILNIQNAPKAIPLTIPNTNIAWPKPSGQLNQYSGIQQKQHANDLLGLKSLHNQGITGEGYSVAFIDSSIVRSHPAFTSTDVTCVASTNGGNDEVVGCPSSFSGFSHGQGVAGTIGGSFGVAPGVKLISIQNNGPDSITQGLNWVAQNYRKYNIVAVSLSIGAGVQDRSSADIICGVLNPPGLQAALTKISNLDVAVLFSTANQSTINWVREPNCLPGVISVASVRSDHPQMIAPYSSISPDVDLLAPADFYSTGSNNDEIQFGGTSQATPFAAAIFALGKQARPDANIAQIFYFMKQTAAPVDDYFAKNIPIVRPVEMVQSLKESKILPPITLVKQIQVKSGG